MASTRLCTVDEISSLHIAAFEAAAREKSPPTVLQPGDDHHQQQLRQPSSLSHPLEHEHDIHGETLSSTTYTTTLMCGVRTVRSCIAAHINCHCPAFENITPYPFDTITADLSIIPSSDSIYPDSMFNESTEASFEDDFFCSEDSTPVGEFVTKSNHVKTITSKSCQL